MDDLFVPRKICYGCGESKIISANRTVSEFSPHTTTKDGFQTKCKTCRNLAFREKGARDRGRALLKTYAINCKV